MKPDEEKLEELLSRGPFNDLNAAEKEFVVSMLGSKEQFDSLQTIESRLRKYSADQAPLPSPRVLTSLTGRMRRPAREWSWLGGILRFKVPAYAVLLLLVIASTLTAKLSTGSPVLPLAEVPKLRVDTVYAMRTDTVYREKTVTRYVPVPVPPKDGVKSIPTANDLVLGVSMKDKEELDKLLVGVN